MCTLASWWHARKARIPPNSAIPVSHLLLPILSSLLNHITHKRATQQNRWLLQTVMLVAQRAHTSRLQDQAGVVRDVLADPSPSESAEDVAVRDNEHVVGLLDRPLRFADGGSVEARADIGDEGVKAACDVLG